MPRRGTDFTNLLRLIAYEDDGLPSRKVRPWTRDKLAVLAYYLQGFAKLCEGGPGGWYYLDGFAGNGTNRTQGFGLAKGSALLGVTQVPPPRRAVLIELDAADAAALRQRVAPYSTFATVRHGDCNELILSSLAAFTNRSLPGFCVLDPEGLELDWTTIEACAAHREPANPNRYELLIYFSTPGTARAAGVRSEDYVGPNERRLTRTFGGDAWRAIADRQRAGELMPGESGRLYLELYEKQLGNLGYTTILDRPVFDEDGRVLYHLVFATANEAGRSIMLDAFAKARANMPPLPLF